MAGMMVQDRKRLDDQLRTRKAYLRVSTGVSYTLIRATHDTVRGWARDVWNEHDCCVLAETYEESFVWGVQGQHLGTRRKIELWACHPDDVDAELLATRRREMGA